jgi:glycosyltransferase 2 family protein
VRRSWLGLAARIAAGAALLAVVVWYADPKALLAQLRRADPWLFALAAIVAICGNLLSVTRWALIARGLGLVAPIPRMILMYARGITTNMILPGAMLSGDVLRSVQLARLGNPFGSSALSVFLDRFSGLWMLCGMSLIATLAVLVWKLTTGGGPAVPLHQLAGYVLALAAGLIAPVMPLPFAKLERSRVAWVAKLALRWERLELGVQRARPALLSSAWRSFGVQVLAACTLWICGLSVGVSLPYPVMLAAAAPIFIMASLPIGVAGFGTREVAAVIVLGALGVPSEQAIATGLLYGMAAVVQGILGAPLFFAKA